MANARLKDMTGQCFGQWRVLHKDGNSPRGAALWKCICSCENEATISGGDLRSGKSSMCKSCSMRIKSTTHGLSKTRLFRIYKSMKSRCYNKNFHKYKTYGAVGITICDDWLNDFMQFHSWAISNGYQDSLTIDRIDNKKGYHPENCRWATAQTQSENRRFVAKNEDGKLWWHIARENHITQGAYRSRLHSGWTHEKASTTPLRSKPLIDPDDNL